MRVDADWHKSLDDWRRQQPEIPSRAEAVRQAVRELVGQALGKEGLEVTPIEITLEMIEAGGSEYLSWQESECYLIDDLVINLYRRLRVLEPKISVT